ncbi:hypothetical protein QLX08_004989 [Tetragonisca angustula]|uniref:Uncharacterized protein n=1 Tax=Tetragonisca angustula TaxID=166442 RepID=A0AAW0ZZW9_9HYME
MYLSPFSEKDIILASSEFASLMTVLKMSLKKLGDDIEYHADHLGETNNKMFQTHGVLEKNLKSWMSKLQAYLQEFDLYGRAITVRTFLNSSNYLYILRTFAIKDHEQRSKISVCNVAFPEHEENKLSTKLYKMKKFKRRCRGKNLTKNSVCRMETTEYP